MKNIIQFALAVILCGYVYPARYLSSVVVVEGGVVMGNTLPRYGVLCEAANVQGNPHDGCKVIYTLPKGERVRLREQGGEGRAWVMIAPANWIRLTALCGF